MSIIKVLPENLVNQIAAGEVVERPASVVKELVENSLDAGASDIVIEVKNAGKTLIKITDNGCGMEKDDCILALQRHATSKLLDESGLWNIKTMGFRGEALASISSVSQLTLRSKIADAISGTEINCEAGEMKIMQEVGMQKGTQIEVRNLFFNTPARQKYLKKESTELAHTSAVLNSIALANPQVSFKFIHNERVIFDLPKVTDLISRISDIFGRATADAMVPVFYGGSAFQIDGFVGKPVISRSSSQHQYFFVNKRPIQHFLLANTIKEAFHSMLMENKKPVFIINIKIDPSLIDVNVHPRKLEIRFEDQQAMIRTMYSMVKSTLEKTNLTPKAFTESQRYMSDRNFSAGKSPSVQDAMEFSKNFVTERVHTSELSEKSRSVFQVANSYIVAEGEDGVILIDQHAAHERVRYEQLMNQFENENKTVQSLLIPLQIECTADEVSLIEENKNVFEGLGFSIEAFSGNTFIVNAVPSFLAKEDLAVVINGVIDDILNEKSSSKFQGNKEAIINYMACRSAIKFGQKLSAEEMQSLIRQMDTLKRPYTCPHGRPTMLALSTSELERMFGRK